MMPPLRLQPIMKQRPWGGRRLAQLWGRPASRELEAEGWAESWEVVDHGEDQSRISGGEFDGRLLGELIRECGAELLGEQAAVGSFPLLFKFLDAAERLSVQVHPNDEQAARLNVGHRGKSEAWVILAAEPGSELSVGLKPHVDRSTLEKALAAGTIAECLHTFPAIVGNVIAVPAGTVHVIGAGVTLAEIQQSSDITFRLFDWNRRDANGQPRALHVIEALQCIDFASHCENPRTPLLLGPQQFAATGQHADWATRHEELIRNPYFVWRRHQAHGSAFVLPTCGRCRIVSLIEGRADLSSPFGSERLVAGDALLIPASCDTVRVTPTNRCTMLEAIPE